MALGHITHSDLWYCLDLVWIRLRSSRELESCDKQIMGDIKDSGLTISFHSICGVVWIFGSKRSGTEIKC